MKEWICLPSCGESLKGEHQLGPDMLCFASDYPHPEGSNDPIGKFEATMDGVDQAALDAFYAGNIEHFLG